MIYEISSGNGPAECELAVTKFLHYLINQYNAKIVTCSYGINKHTYRSVSVSCETNLDEFIGSILWVCKSPYRPQHKRKKLVYKF